MPMTRTQAFRHMGVAGPGDEVLLLRSISGTEQLGRLFEYQLECVSENEEVSFEEWLGQNVSIRFSTHGGEEERFLNGIVSEMEQTGVIGRLAVYRLVVVPFIWILTRRADCRIFQDKTVPEIVVELLKERGFSDVEDRLTRSYRPWEYCVQYRETDLNFITRLMEQEGMYFYFVHEEGKHTLVLGDDPGSHEKKQGVESLPFFPPGAKSVARPHVYHWRVRKQIQTTAYATTDFNYERPKDDLFVRGSKLKSHEFGEIEMFDYPGEYAEYADGETIARLRTEELAVAHETIDAQTTSRQVGSGQKFALEGHPRGDQARDYLVVGTTLEASTDAYDGGQVDTDGSFTFRCGFDCIPGDTPFRLARSTPKPVIPGPQTAIVDGLDGEDITTDELGRVWVRFHWDLYSKPGERATCWLRSSQDIAGKKWGAMYVPRKGHEVIVTFMEGDPDRPLITGRVYNGENKPAYDPKSMPTISGIKTNTVKGEGFNEIRFDDKAGHEQIFIHAQKDMDIRVKETVRHTVEKEYHFTVESNYYYKTGGDHHVETSGSYHETICGDRHIIADGNEMKEIGGNQDLTVSGSVTEGISGAWSVDTSGAITIKSATGITLECGGSKVEIKPGGVRLTSAGPIINKAGGAFQVKSALTKVQSGTVSVKAGSVGVKAGIIKADAAMVKMSGASMSVTHISQAAVVSPSITPAAGNIL
ncbi:MAG: type VI secretion system tip protein VgrG [Phycisphaerales bacterium]|nr:type VI secretion system tip protein VgrG [Phycisphaerales bacterium]